VNDEAARQSRPAFANISVPGAPLVVRALELIHDGRRFTTGDLPSEIVEEVVHLLEGIELGLSDRERRERCGTCGATFAWPGEHDHHRRFVHWGQAAA
jgi:hypothetical protein